MDPETRTLLAEVGRRLIEGTAGDLRPALASWMNGSTVEQLWEEVQAVERETRVAWDEVQIGAADGFEIDDTRVGVAELRENGVPLPREITAQSFLAWCCLTITADAGDWALYDLWCAVVRDGGRPAVGYVEVVAPVGRGEG